MSLTWQECLPRLAVAFLLGALIGLERQRQQRPAGLRTHLLVCVASALFTMCSLLAAGNLHDPGRIAAQIVTGIGFLGAGTIMRHGSIVTGLTTAASLWMVAALGMAAGYGWYLGAVLTGGLAFVVLTLVKVLEEHLPAAGHLAKLIVRARPGTNPLADILQTVTRLGAQLEEVAFGDETVAEGLTLRLTIEIPAGLKAAALAPLLLAVDGVAEITPGR